MNVKRMKHILGKLFVGGYWMVGYRVKSLDSQNRGGYRRVDAPEGCWIADPFLYESEGNHYLFVELYKSRENRAGIGYYEFQNGEPVYRGTIIEQPYHMSYPCVFSFKGDHYIIPESSAHNTIELYKAKRFPDVWVKEKELLTGEKHVDSTVYCENGDYYLFSYKKEKEGWELIVFELDMEMQSLHKLYSRYFKTNIGRPAGLLWQNGSLYRPAQNCKNKYGESVLIYEISRFDREGMEESFSSEIVSAEILFPEKHDRIHTINQDGKYEVVDVFREKIDIFHGWRILKRAYLNKNGMKDRI